MRKKRQRRQDKLVARQRRHDQELESKNDFGKRRFTRPGSNKK